MPRRETFGGSSNWADVFAQLAREDLARAQAATRQAVAQAEEDQAAKDAEVYSQWKNGEISDEEWLAYLSGRVADTAGDPEENSKWKDALREHTGAIEDSKAETNYSMKTISIGQLMQHYKNRMAQVEKNSPAWRELAARYAELSDYAASGGGGGGGGGGGRGGTGTDADINALPAAYRTNDEGPVDPTNTLRLPGTIGEYLDGSFADLNRIDEIMRQYKENPDAEFLYDPLTGEPFKPTMDMILAIDSQYLRTEDQIAVVKWAIGDVDGATKALTAKGNYISSVMVPHNTERLSPSVQEFEQSIIDSLHTASASGNPQLMQETLEAIKPMVENFMDGWLPPTRLDSEGNPVANPNPAGALRLYLGQGKTRFSKDENDTMGGMTKFDRRAGLPEELRPALDMYDRLNAWIAFSELSDSGLSEAEFVRRVNQIYADLPSEGGLGKEDIDNLIQGEIDPEDLSAGLIGAETHRHHKEGLLRGADPGFDGPRFTYTLSDDGRTVVTQGDIRQTKSGQFEVVPANDDPSTMTRVAVNIGGRITQVWAKPKPVDVPGYMVVFANKSLNINGKEIAEGTAIPSSILQARGKGWLTAAINRGDVYEQSRLDGVVLPGGAVWYWDEATNMFYRPNSDGSAPHIARETDALGYSRVDDNGQPVGQHISGAKGYAVAYDEYRPGRPGFSPGITNRQMQSWVESRLADGTLDPNDYYQLGVDGNAGEPADFKYMYETQEDIRGALYRRINSARVASLAEDERQRAHRREYVSNWLNREVLPNMEEWRKREQEAPDAQSVEDFGRSVGIDIGGPGDSGKARRGRDRSGPNLTNPLVARDDALAAAKKRAAMERIRAAEPKFEAKLPKKAALPKPKTPAPKVTPPIKKVVKTPPSKAPKPILDKLLNG